MQLIPLLNEEESNIVKKTLEQPIIKSVSNYFENCVQFVWVSSYINFSPLFTSLIESKGVKQVWKIEVEGLAELFFAKYKAFINAEGGEVILGKDYLNEIEKELMQLPLIVTEQEEQVEEESALDLEQLISDIKQDVKKGNRVTFKLLQELQTKLFEIEDETDEKQEEERNKLERQTRKEIKDLTFLLLEVFDLIDLVRTTSLQQDDEVWTAEITNVVDKGLDLLVRYGIEEIPALGKSFDGRIMEGIGTISMDDIQGEMEQYQVHSVFQRGFQYTHNQELIRRAKVITVY